MRTRTKKGLITTALILMVIMLSCYVLQKFDILNLEKRAAYAQQASESEYYHGYYTGNVEPFIQYLEDFYDLDRDDLDSLLEIFGFDWTEDSIQTRSELRSNYKGKSNK